MEAVDEGQIQRRVALRRIGFERCRPEALMSKDVPRTGKRVRPKTAVRGKRYRCAGCRKRSPKPVKAPAPWYCPNCLRGAGPSTSR
jgi:hypothetical protein